MTAPAELLIADSPFDMNHHAHTLLSILKRSVELGPKYYLRDLPRYFVQRRRLGLSLVDLGVFINPVREFRRRNYGRFEMPPSLPESLRLLGAAGVRLSIPPRRLEGLVGAWWATRGVPGDVIECGSFRGATALLLGLMGKLEQRQGSVLMLDTFDGIPAKSRYDNTRSVGEFAAPTNQVEVIVRQASLLGLEDRVQIHRGLFSRTFELLDERDPKFSFVHIDANVYSGTKEAWALSQEPLF